MIIKKYKTSPFKENQAYTTRFATQERFIIKEIVYSEKKISGVVVKKMIGFKGIYVNNRELGICPLPVDRLIPEIDRRTEYEIKVCDNCKEPI